MDHGSVTGRGLALALRERALAALEVSTTMLTVGQNLQRQGNLREAARLRNEARYKRNESILLMDQARKVEKGASNLLGFPNLPNRRTAEAGTKQAENSEEGSPLLRAGRRNSRAG
jgi:hypothetical protein